MEYENYNNNYNENYNRGYNKNKKTKLLPAWALFLIDVALIGIGLVVFAYFHHVRPRPLPPQTIIVPSDTPEAPVNTVSSQDDTDLTQTPEPTRDPDEWGAAFLDKFTQGDVEKTENTYRSKDIAIEVSRHEQDGTVYFVQDIYVRYKGNFKTALAKDTYGMGYRDMVGIIAEENNAIAAVNGDYYGHSDQGVVIRNGEFYRDTPFRDVCVLYNDGTMKTFSKSEFDAKTEMANGAYQAWGFGPMLLDKNGQPMEEFDTDVPSDNPRTVLGYYEPGHYCFIVVDGRNRDYSRGFSAKELSKLVYDMGCVAAYNMDGGQTSAMYFDGSIVNEPANGGRECSDIIFIGEIDNSQR